MMDNEIDRELLEKIADLLGKPVGAFNIRKDSGCDGRQSTEHIEITSKTDGKSGIDIRIKDGTVGETCHIPVIITKPGIEEMVYNDFYIGENCNVEIVAGCGIHNCGDQTSRHDGLHTFYVGKNSHVHYTEKHYGEGDGKGGRIMKWSALVVVGDGNGLIGFGIGKASETPDAIRKAIADAKKNLFKVSTVGTTIPHEVVGKFGAAEILLKPAPKGTGVIAGGPVRQVMEAAGIRDIRTKSLRSNNQQNVVTATVEGLKSLRCAEDVARTRGKTVDEIQG